MQLNSDTVRDAVWDLGWLRKRYLWTRKDSPRRAMVVFWLFIVVILILGLFGFLLAQDIVSSDEIFSGISIDGNPVGGLSRTEAHQMVAEKISPAIDQTMVLTLGEEGFDLELGGIDFSVNEEGMVDKAYWAGQGQFVFARMFKRLFNRPVHADIPVMVDYSDKKLEKYIADLAAQVDYEPTSARIDISSGYPDVVPSLQGLEVDQKATFEAVGSALPTPQRRIPLVVEFIDPELTTDDIAYIIVIDLSAQWLYLYHREEFVNSYIVSTGMDSYPTPTGKFHVTYKEEDPVWLPTSAWAEEKQGIPQEPGPDNPLGKYWIDIGAGLGIHATPFESSLGEPVSHGCIRLATWAAEEVYEAVNPGTPVFILE